MKTDMVFYEAPEMRERTLELEGFICGSVEKQMFMMETDEFVIMGTEDLG